MSDPADFLSLAAQCFQLVDETRAPDDRTILMNMAQAWLNLAIEEEQVTKLVREADVAFEIRAADATRGAPLWAMDLSAPHSNWDAAPSTGAA
jgi:hypothetical protein